MSRVRSRLSDGLSTRRLALEVRRSRKPVVAILVGIALALICVFYILENVGQTVYTSSRTVGFVVSDASGVIGGGRQQLEFKGIPAGTINGTDLHNGQAEVTGSIFTRFGPIYRNAEVTLRPGAPLQDMYIDILDRGTPSAGLATTHNPVKLQYTSTSVQVGDVLDAFQPEVRNELAETLSQLGGGLKGQGTALEETFVQVVPFLREAAELTHGLGVRGQLTRELVHNAGTLTAALGQRQQDLRAFVKNTGVTVQALANQDASLNATLHDLPTFITDLNSSFATLQQALPSLNTALGKLEPVAHQLPTSLVSLHKLSTQALPTVRDLQTPVQKLLPLSSSLRPLAENLEEATDKLSPQIPDINNIVSAVAACPTGLQAFFQWTPSVTKFWSSTGAAVRGDFVFSPDNTTVLGDPTAVASSGCEPGQVAGGTPGPTLPAEAK